MGIYSKRNGHMSDQLNTIVKVMITDMLRGSSTRLVINLVQVRIVGGVGATFGWRNGRWEVGHFLQVIEALLGRVTSSIHFPGNYLKWRRVDGTYITSDTRQTRITDAPLQGFSED